MTTLTSFLPGDPGRAAIDTTKPNFGQAALSMFKFGLSVIPIIPGEKRPAVKWDPWLAKLSPESIQDYWQEHPDHEFGFIVGDDLIIFDADTPMSGTALRFPAG